MTRRTLYRFYRRLGHGHLVKRGLARLRAERWWVFSAVVRRRADTRRPYCLVYGKSDFEENLFAWTLAWSEVYLGKVVLLVGDPQAARHRLKTVAKALGITPRQESIDIRRSDGLRIAWLQAGADAVFTTHVLFPARRSRRGALYVHLSHGLGPKTYRNYRFPQDAVMSPSKIWFSQHVEQMGLPKHTPRINGYPRLELLHGPAARSDESKLQTLGLGRDRPFVLWMPTFREVDMGWRRNWKEGTRLTSSQLEKTLLPPRSVARWAEAHGVQLVIKPHTIDADRMDNLGARVLKDDHIWGAGLTPSQLMNMSRGLICDYSAVLVDYLTLSRPVGVFAPDLDEFEVGMRGLCVAPSFAELVDPLRLKTGADADEFFACIEAGDDFRSVHRARIAKQIGVDVPGPGYLAETVSAVHGLFSLRPGKPDS